MLHLLVLYYPYSEGVVIPKDTDKALEMSKFSEESTYMYVWCTPCIYFDRKTMFCLCMRSDPDTIQTSGNEAYHTVRQTRGGAGAEYETVSAPHTVPPPTSHSMEPIAGDSLYEPV